VSKVIEAQYISLKALHRNLHAPYENEMIVEYHPDWYGGTLSNGIGLGDSAFPSLNNGHHRWEVMGHEQGHNFFGTKSGFYWDLVVEGPFIQESFAVLSTVYFYNDIIQNPDYYGLEQATIESLDYVFANERAYQEEMYNEYIQKGKNFNINEVQTSQALDYMMIIYGERYGWENYIRFTKAFEDDIKYRFSFLDDGSSAEEQSTYIIAALSVAFDQDFRSDFEDLNFPIDYYLYNEIYWEISDYVNN